MSYDGNLYFLDQHQRAEDRWLESRPVCEDCGEPIQDEHAYETNRGVLCLQCARNYAEILAEDFIQEVLDDWKIDNY